MSPKSYYTVPVKIDYPSIIHFFRQTDHYKNKSDNDQVHYTHTANNNNNIKVSLHQQPIKEGKRKKIKATIISSWKSLERKDSEKKGSCKEAFWWFCWGHLYPSEWIEKGRTKLAIFLLLGRRQKKRAKSILSSASAHTRKRTRWLFSDNGNNTTNHRHQYWWSWCWWWCVCVFGGSDDDNDHDDKDAMIVKLILTFAMGYLLMLLRLEKIFISTLEKKAMCVQGESCYLVVTGWMKKIHKKIMPCVYACLLCVGTM